MAYRTVEDIAARQLCTSCGACVVACPVGAVQLMDTPVGLVRPRVDRTLCTGCGLCVRTCPGRRVEVHPGETGDVYAGTILDTYCGHATATEVRQRGQSGGVVTALAGFLLQEGEVDGVIATDMPEDSSLRARGVIVRDCAGLLSTQGSKYSPVAPVAALTGCRSDERVAFVGLPCQVHGIRNLQACSAARIPDVDIAIGLVCDRTLMGVAADIMACDAGVDPTRVQSLKYRDRERIGWPGELSFTTEAGERVFAPSAIRHRLKDYVTPPRCRVCFDKLNILADVVIGDPWGVAEAPDGLSVIVTRTDAGHQLIERALEHGAIVAQPVEPERVLAGQHVNARRESHQAYLAEWNRRKLERPEVAGISSAQGRKAKRQALSHRLWLGINLWVADSRSRAIAMRRVQLLRIVLWPILRSQRALRGLRCRANRALGRVVS